ncbi:MAG: glucose-6-phosphate isomerase [bacterium]
MKDAITIDYTNMMADSTGPEHGISEEELKAAADAFGDIHTEIEKKRENHEIGFLDLPYQNLTRIFQLSSSCGKNIETLVVLGIGGSALGARALANALLKPFYNLKSSQERDSCPRLLVADNIDPETFTDLLATVDPASTGFIVISKSGGTAETMSQFLIAREWLMNNAGEDGYRERMVAITDEEKGHLRKIVDKDGLPWLTIPGNVGGRYSVFSNVGLLPAAMCGMDIVSLLKGAAAMDRRIKENEFFANPAYLLGALYYLADVKKHKNILVMMPYSSRLLLLAEWFQQLWAESLGKAVHVDGSPANVGSTPVRAMGATDQHSQLQLYQEGPNDKVISFIRIEEFQEQGPIPEALSDVEGVAYLGGHSLAELINTEQKATELALIKAKKPNLCINMPVLNAHTLGQLMYMMEAATVFAGGLYKVNPLDQPGVELGKKYTFSMMGRKGYEDVGEEVLSWDRERKRYTA